MRTIGKANACAGIAVNATIPADRIENKIFCMLAPFMVWLIIRRYLPAKSFNGIGSVEC